MEKARDQEKVTSGNHLFKQVKLDFVASFAYHLGKPVFFPSIRTFHKVFCLKNT